MKRSVREPINPVQRTPRKRGVADFYRTYRRGFCRSDRQHLRTGQRGDEGNAVVLPGANGAVGAGIVGQAAGLPMLERRQPGRLPYNDRK